MDYNPFCNILNPLATNKTFKLFFEIKVRGFQKGLIKLANNQVKWKQRFFSVFSGL